MLNEDKIKLMAGIAMYEKKEGKKIFPINDYFRIDYIGSHILGAFFRYTFCYLLCVLLWVLYSIERILNLIYLDDIIAIVKKMGVFYLLGLAAYLIIAVAVSAVAYEKASQGMKLYIIKLKSLDKRYEFQNMTRELEKDGGYHDKSPRV